MIKNPLEIFEEIAHIPHMSFHTQEMFEYICGFAKGCGYKIETDKAKNIRAFASDFPEFCFQSHYDMVGVGEAYKPLKLYREGDFLKAKNSSLGADNGIGVAIQLYLMQKYRDLEFLFTNDEEVGLLGAKNLELKIACDLIVNLDSETFGEIVLGCAGGYDMSVVLNLPKDPSSYKFAYRISSRGFKGGHSGIDINKDIKNAIVSLGELIDKTEGGICSFEGGEKINSIPVFSQVVLKTNQILHSCSDFLVEEVQSEDIPYQKDRLLAFILGIKSGVRAQSGEDVIDSVNISLLKQTDSQVKVSLMGRANTKDLLEKNLSEIKALALRIDPKAEIAIDDFYAPWERNIAEGDSFLEIVKKSFGDYLVKVCQIHAGLECGILQDRLENMGKKNLKILSIGPTILSPHSLNERLDMKAFEKFFQVLENLIENYKIWHFKGRK
ncbi:M28 family peptidase [Helicobacter sp. 12S02232-10]|uniref:M28 family peptidase n=1 Tax=Helicobacter sp. 12S02232-10 TaxID=1476197 RepID=UPI0015DFFF00|nr:M28 family peptidase [Helicobacter sp. 12S02232-10]